jgi:hypothetical protein
MVSPVASSVTASGGVVPKNRITCRSIAQLPATDCRLAEPMPPMALSIRFPAGQSPRNACSIPQRPGKVMRNAVLLVVGVASSRLVHIPSPSVLTTRIRSNAVLVPVAA